MKVGNVGFRSFTVVPQQQKPEQKIIVQEDSRLGKGGGGKAIASIFPGLGQFCDGRNKAGFGFLGALIGTGIAYSVLGNAAIKSYSKSAFKSAIIYGIGAGLLYTAIPIIYIANIIDAYKGGLLKTADK